MGFAERHGFVEAKPLQIEYIDTALRNRIFNAVHNCCEKSQRIHDDLIFVIDKIGYVAKQTDYYNWQLLDDLLLDKHKNTPWYMPYEIIEAFFASKLTRCKYCAYKHPRECSYCSETEWLKKHRLLSTQY